MDSLSQFALGAAIGVAVMHRRSRPWKAAVIGGLVATLPDLDSFYDHGDPISNVTLHRANSAAREKDYVFNRAALAAGLVTPAVSGRAGTPSVAKRSRRTLPVALEVPERPRLRLEVVARRRDPERRAGEVVRRRREDIGGGYARWADWRARATSAC
jgi:hypothetical protein